MRKTGKTSSMLVSRLVRPRPPVLSFAIGLAGLIESCIPRSTHGGSFFCLELADAGVEVAQHASVRLLQPEKTAAPLARLLEHVHVFGVAGGDQAERGAFAVAAGAALLQLLDQLVLLVAGGLALGGNQ